MSPKKHKEAGAVDGQQKSPDAATIATEVRGEVDQISAAEWVSGSGLSASEKINAWKESDFQIFENSFRAMLDDPETKNKFLTKIKEALGTLKEEKEASPKIKRAIKLLEKLVAEYDK